MKEAAGVADRAARRRARPVLPARAGAARAAAGAEARPAGAGVAGGGAAAARAEPPDVSLAHMALRFPPVSQFVERFRALLRAADAVRLRARRSTGSRGSRSPSRSSRCSICDARTRSRSSRRRRSRRSGFPVPTSKGTTRGPSAPPDHRQPGRPARPDDRGAARRGLAAADRRRSSWRRPPTSRSASRPRSVCSRERYREGRSGIVLEQVAGGWAFRAAREAAEACGRLFERPVQRSLSQASLETLAIVAYLGPCTRPDDRADPRRRPRTRRSRAWSNVG